MAEKYVVGRASDLADGERVIVNAFGRSIGVFNIAGRFYAFLNRCPHRGAQICRGDVLSRLESDRPGQFVLDRSRRYLVCPWHGWEYDIVTGQSWFDPVKKARPFRVDVETGQVVADEMSEGSAVDPGTDVAQFIDPVTHRIKGPYHASVVPVGVEDEYIVLSLKTQPAREAADGADGKGRV